MLLIISYYAQHKREVYRSWYFV